MAEPATDLFDIPDHLKRAMFPALRDEADRLVERAATERVNLDAEKARWANAGPEERAFAEDPAFGPSPSEIRDLAQARIQALHTRYCEAQSLADALIAPEAGVASSTWWADSLADAVSRIKLERAEADAQARAQAARAGAAECMTWQAMAETLWGPNYITPLAIVARCNKRTIERANHPEEERLPGWINVWLEDTMARVPEDLRRAYGLVMRGAMTVEDGAEVLRLARVDVETGRLP